MRRPATRPTRIEDTLFEEVLTLGISGDAGALVRGNRFRDMRGAALTVARTPGAQVLGNLFSGRMPTNAIRLEAASADGVIAGNVILGGARAGLAFGTAIAALYAVLYLLLQLEQRALLLGSLLLFAVLAALMFGTRRVDWYGLLARLRGEAGNRST